MKNGKEIFALWLQEFASFMLLTILVLSLVVGIVFFAGNSYENAARENGQRRQEFTVSESEFARTIIHDGHWWVVWKWKEDVNHHPDCPCNKLLQAEKGVN